VDEAVRRALVEDLTVDITTTGRRTGEARRIEIWMLHVDGRWFVTGTPGPRDWLANLRADPRLTLHLKESVRADLAATAREVTDESTRRAVLTHAASTWYRGQTDVEDLVARAPMVELLIDDR
jgi:deazaflavin-dependent oxidoreductase (nitroreductase family)